MRPTPHQSQSPTVRPSIAEVERYVAKLGGKIRPTGQDIPELPTTHIFTPGLYTRTILMRAGMIVTSRIHRTEHPFVVSQGHCLVYDDRNGPVSIKAPYMGITKPGTHRVLLILKDTIWSTFHATELTDVKEIEEWLAEPLSAHPGLVSFPNPYTNKCGEIK